MTFSLWVAMEWRRKADPWLIGQNRITVLGDDGKEIPQTYQFELLPLKPEEFGSAPAELKCAGRFSRFVSTPCPYLILSPQAPNSGDHDMYWPEDYASERVEWIVANTRCNWNMAIQNSSDRCNRMFSLDFSFDDEVAALHFKMRFS